MGVKQKAAWLTGGSVWFQGLLAGLFGFGQLPLLEQEKPARTGLNPRQVGFGSYPLGTQQDYYMTHNVVTYCTFTALVPTYK